MTQNVATGTFDVNLTPMTDPDAAVGRLELTKTFQGDLQGASVGTMLAIRTVEGSAGYVAMERVTGSLDGREGSFALQHSGTMDRSSPTLTVATVPDSGTKGLTGLKGTMIIDVSGEEHRYTFHYTLPTP